MKDNTGTGWPGIRQYMHDATDPYSHHANVKLNQEQLDYIYDSDIPISQWIREAIQARIDTEAHYKRAKLAREAAHGTAHHDTP